MAYSTNKKDPSILLKITEEAKKQAELWIRHSKFYNRNEFPEEFPTEIAVEFIKQLKIKGEIEKPLHQIWNLCSKWAKLTITRKIAENISGSHTTSVCEDRLSFKLDLKKILDNCTTKQKVLILYFVFYSNIKNVSKLHKFLEDKDFTIITDKITTIKNDLFTSVEFDFNSYIPKSVIGSALFLSILFQKNPELASLFVLLKDIKKLFQFIVINQKTTITIPTLNEFLPQLISIGESVRQIENGQLYIKNLSVLTELINPPNGETKIINKFEDFLQELFKSILDTHQKFTDKLIGSVGATTDKTKLIEIYKILNTEIVAQYKLMETLIHVFNPQMNLNQISKILQTRS